MKRFFIAIGLIVSTTLFCGCEKMCKSTLTAEDGTSLTIDGDYYFLMSGETMKVKRGSVINLTYGTRVYQIDECGELYVIFKENNKFYLTKY